MTCLAPSSSGLAHAVLCGAIEQLRNCWCSLGLDDSIFLAGQPLQASLASLRKDQRHELLITILGLCEEPQRCIELQPALELGCIDPAAEASLLRSVATLQPVLALRLAALHVFKKGLGCCRGTEESQGGSRYDIALLGVSLRMENTLRRNGFHQLRDLIGLDEQQVLDLRGVGSAGLRELCAGLERLQLPFPLTSSATALFTPAEVFELFKPTHSDHPRIQSPEASALDVAMPQLNPVFGGWWPDPTEERLAEEQQSQKWMERAQALIGGTCAEVPSAHRILDELVSLTLEHFSGLGSRSRELQQLRSVFFQIESTGITNRHCQLAAEGLQCVLLQAYSQQFHSVMRAQTWLRDLMRAIEADRAIEWFLRLSAGETLQSIVDQFPSPISREAVRKRYQRLVECAGLTPRELAARLTSRREEQARHRLLDTLQPWLQTLGRLPFHTDSDNGISNSSCPAVVTAGDAVVALNLHQRLDLYTTLGLDVPEAEWALHLRVIANAEQDVGVGYWHREDAMAEFLHRYAVLLGAPGLMPKQVQLPTAVKGAVQRFGGQGAVAAKVGLTYQGQLVGENGRTYWTEERLRALLEQTASHFDLAAEAMPTRPQISTFLSSGVVPDYLNKQPNSVFAALTRQGILRWPQVAERFGMVFQSVESPSPRHHSPSFAPEQGHHRSASATLVAVQPRA